MEANVTENLTEGLSPRFGMSDEIVVANLSTDNFLEFSDEEQTQESEEPDDVIILHMDIREPLRTLRKLLETKVGLNLKNYTFWLQDSQELEPHKNLVDQCVKGEGLVQINVQIQTTNERINIIDVLKPTEAALASLSVEQTYKKDRNSYSCESLEDCFAGSNSEIDIKAENIKTEIKQKEQPCLNWVPDSKFKKEQIRLKIPEDPQLWTIPQVKHWFQWARREFNLSNVLIADWSITGKQLCALTHHEFRQKLTRDPGNIFWTHLQLLKECKYVAIVHKEVEAGSLQKTTKSDLQMQNQTSSLAKSQRELKIMRKTFKGDQKSPFQRTNNAPYAIGAESTNMQMVPSGQMQLWQFLLELLTDSNHTDVIKWVGNEGEFVLLEPEAVARLWGLRKNKPAMNYEKLSRALRYYYDGDMISKVCGKRFAYKFDCDLKLLIGYDAGELARLVNHRPYQSEAAFAAEQIIKDIQSEADD